MSTAISQAQFAFRKGTSSREEDMKVDEEFVAVFTKYGIRVQDLFDRCLLSGDTSVKVRDTSVKVFDAFCELRELQQKRRHANFDKMLHDVNTEVTHGWTTQTP